MSESEQIRPIQPAVESIDFGKLGMILRNNWIWITLIFLVINSVAYLVIRYTKNLYESDSEIKLDVKSDASELGINSVIEDPYLNLMSGEIEIIQSRLFLTQVVNESDFEISFWNMGRVLNEEIFRNAPVFIKVDNKDHDAYNTPIFFNEVDEHSFTLRIRDAEVSGHYGDWVEFSRLRIRLTRNSQFRKGDEVGYYFIINSRDALLDYLVRNLTAEPLNYNANTIRVAFKDNNPFKAQAVLNKIDTIYLRYSNEQKNLANKQKIDWLVNELSLIEKRMEEYENYFENFTLENKTNDLNEDLKKTIEAINRVDSQRYDLARKLREIDGIQTAIDDGTITTRVLYRQSMPEHVNRSLEELVELQLAQERLKLSYSEITLAYREKQQKADNLKKKLLSQLGELRTSWNARLVELNRQKTNLEQNFANFPDKNTEFSKNQRFYKLYEEFYLTLMQSKSQFEIAQAGTTPDFKILSPASFPYRPISPNRPMIMGVGLVLSLIINLLFLGLLYLLNNKITNLSELERINPAPVLGSVPVSRYSNEVLHVLQYPKSMVSEAIRSLRTNLDFFNISSRQKVLAISSTVSGEGKSFIAMNLGGILALSKKRVVLIDLDMRKSKSNQPVKDVDNTKGVSTILIRKHTWQDCVIHTSLENFDFIPSGPHPPNPSELLLNGEFADLIESLKLEYDFIILDTPPVGLVTDGIMAMRRADLSIYIFRANYSRKDFLGNLQRIITLNKFSNVTTLLNAIPSNGKTYGYGYYEENAKSGSKVRSFFNF